MEVDLSPEPDKNTEKERSPKVKTFMELALVEAEVKWSEGRKEK